MKKPVALIIMDGFGESKNTDGNAIASSNTPNLDKIMNEYPHTLIQASGLDVGLPDGQMGNSEVGHTNIGAGRIVYQDLTRVSKAIEDGDFFTNEVLLKAMGNAKEHSLHLMGKCICTCIYRWKRRRSKKCCRIYRRCRKLYERSWSW